MKICFLLIAVACVVALTSVDCVPQARLSRAVAAGPKKAAVKKGAAKKGAGKKGAAAPKAAAPAKVETVSETPKNTTNINGTATAVLNGLANLGANLADSIKKVNPKDVPSPVASVLQKIGIPIGNLTSNGTFKSPVLNISTQDANAVGEGLLKGVASLANVSSSDLLSGVKGAIGSSDLLSGVKGAIGSFDFGSLWGK